MITRICISINNRCNLRCKYCHFHEKQDHITECEMDVFQILDNVKGHIAKKNIKLFKIGFVGNGEPLLDFEMLKEYILYISDYLESGKIAAYTITNGTVVTEEMLRFFQKHHVNVGFSIDGIQPIHNKWRCHSFDKVMEGITLYKSVNGHYPSLNCTVGQDVIDRANETISFFEQFNSRITFSRMIGVHGISLSSFHEFMEKAVQRLNVRTGGYDCTMYGGLCGAGMDNLFFANGRIYICGNCVDLHTPYASDTPLDAVDFGVDSFDRTRCYKEEITV